MYKGVVDVAERFAEVINAELKRLVAAGADYIQLDEPARGNVSGEEMARLYNLATDGVKAKLAFHVCFGNRFGRSRFDRTYRPYFPGLLKARADQFVLEFAGRELSELDVWKEYGAGRELGAGVVDVKGFYPETPEDVAKRIRQVLAVCPAEKLYVNPGLRLRLVAALHVQPEGRDAGRGGGAGPRPAHREEVDDSRSEGLLVSRPSGQLLSGRVEGSVGKLRGRVRRGGRGIQTARSVPPG
jgi:hypothetical protein